MTTEEKDKLRGFLMFLSDRLEEVAEESPDKKTAHDIMCVRAWICCRAAINARIDEIEHDGMPF